MAVGVQPSAHGKLGVVKTFDVEKVRTEYEYNPKFGHYKRSRSGLLLEHRKVGPPIQQRILAWMRDHVREDLPRLWYNLVLGHDLHIAVWGELFVKHFHATQRDPFTGEIGWWENVGLVSRGKVTVAFRNFETAQMVTESSLYGDFKYHEVGTSNQAEANTDTALITTTGIARVTGTQVDGTGTYTSVATVTADTNETWQEHGLFNASTGPTLLDRSLISPTVAVVASDTVQFTYVLTKNAEA